MRPASMATVVLLAALLGAVARAEEQAPPAALIGSWDVEHVAVDEQDQMHWDVRPDDPQLLGRELTIQQGTISRWIAQREPDVLVMHFNDQVLLTLRRRPADAKPRASFDCQKASSPTESAVCGSHELAGWDRSVAAAFREALERSPEKASDLRADQHQWLKKRDACGAKVECIDEMLWRRVEELPQFR
jgi:uncharacterized protein YecT (DUF1311 family)